jgi:prepilin-type N-terminal cleavage/methylation domain-containing protein
LKEIEMLTSTRLNQRREQRGITLIEVSIGLIIAAIIAAAAFIAFQNNSRRQEVRENVSAVTEIASEARNKFIRTGKGADLTTANAKLANLFKPISGGNNSYGGAVTFTAAAPSATPPTPATMTWNSVPVDQCVDLSVALFPNFSSLKIGSTTVTPSSPIADVQGACSTSAATTLVFTL